MAQHILSHLHKILPKEHTWKMKVLREWSSILGPLARKVILHRVDDTAVVLAVNHPSLAQELLMLTDIIRSKINNAIGSEIIMTIHFKTFAQRPEAPIVVQPAPPQEIIKPKIPLTHAEKKQLSSVESQELRSALAEFYSRCKERQA